MGLFGDPKLATCPNDGTPLISTIVFSGAEFYCIECGQKFGWLSPRPVEPNEENNAWYERIKAEWDEHVGNKLLGRFWRDGCDQCSQRKGYHCVHATEAEIEADRKAREWMQQRIGRDRKAVSAR